MPSWIRTLAVRKDASLNTSSEPTLAGPDAPHVVVIGAGFGGLAAAVRLLARGYNVTVVDRLEQPGGRARVTRVEGDGGEYVFDMGPTLITAPFLFDELWEIAGEKREDYVEMVPTTPFYRIRFDDGEVFEYTGDQAAMEEQIARFNPDDVAGYRRFLKKSEAIFETGFLELGHVPFGKFTDMAKIIPSMVLLESHRTVYGLVAKYFKDKRLRQVFSFHPLLVGGNPFSTTSIYALIAYLERHWGVWYAMGGTGAMVAGIAALIERMGGRFRFGETVEEITAEASGGKPRATGVRLAGGEHIGADMVVSNADAAWTYKHLVRPEHRTTWTDKKVDKTKLSMSLFVWYFGTDKKYEDVAHHTILLGKRYKALLDDIFDNHKLADDFSLYLHRPSATDPNMAPPGHDSFYVLSPVPHLESGTDWTKETEKYRKLVEQYLEATVLPGLSEHVTASLALTPKEFEEDYLSLKGAAFSIQPQLTQSAYFRPHNKSEDVEGLFLVGAGTHPGAGMPGVLSSARVLDTLIPDAKDFERQRPSEPLAA
ncbi:phytoene desaturase family protein [Rubricoccus marinus]|uniref:Phytoene dehydrogenase n=1 Tax=Rubricoccus marinus TaxID=716817 RepID=A0A259TZM0_9BACT|nr:phytoene desaturase family protein [Rubricoccus marinus]OZC03028.1 phytoene dehydrogenase [Rubricoccus marinus]